jgi:hypothetical protein
MDHTPPRQRGAALIVALVVLVVVASAILLNRLNAVATPTPFGDRESGESLVRAKDALIAWAAAHPDTPGLLPFPDRSDDATPDYDGTADCVAAAGIAPGDLLGRFPFRGEEAGCAAGIGMSVTVEDSAGERLWYAVSRNLVRGGGGGPVNPDIGDLATQPWITVRDQTGAVISNRVAAVIIAPGPAIAGQDRSLIDPNPAVESPKYLESITVGPDTFDNADTDNCLDDDPGCAVPGEDFIVYPKTTDTFNDRLVFITVDELMAAVEDRVLAEAAIAMRSYQGNNPGNFYPWMSPFTNPRSPQGAATGGSATTLVNTGTDFVAAGVADGDLVRNLSDGSIGNVATGGVSATTLTLVGLIGGVGNAFAAGDQYIVHGPGKFQGAAGTLEGMLPVHMQNEVFQTGFTVNWNYSGEKNSDTFDDGNTNLVPTIDDVDHFSDNGGAGDVTIPPTSGWCKWTTVDRVDCWGFTTISPYVRSDNGLTVSRYVEVWFNFTADPADTTITAPTATDVRRRNHTYNGTNYGPVTPLAAPDMPQKWTSPCCAWTIHIEDTDGANTGWRRAERDASTDLVIYKFDGIRYEIGVGDELPTWFVENNWHHYVHTAVSGAYLPATATTSGSGACVPFAAPGTEDNDCLIVEFAGTTLRTNVDALVIGAGPVAAGQDRSTATACTQPAFFCDYYETLNNDVEPTARNLVYGRDLRTTFGSSAAFNDQVRVVSP